MIERPPEEPDEIEKQDEVEQRESDPKQEEEGPPEEGGGVIRESGEGPGGQFE